MHGTWADQGAKWYHVGSPWSVHMAEHGFLPTNHEQAFEWTGDLNGFHWWQTLFGWLPGITVRTLTDWRTAGIWLRIYLQQYALHDRGCIVHSHGLQPVLFACANGLEIPWLFSGGSPVRHDKDVFDGVEMEVAVAARRNIRFWLHVRDSDGDDTQSKGGWFDGVWNRNRMYRIADLNDGVPGIGHSRIFQDARCFPLWRDVGWFELLRAATDAATPKAA